MSAYEMWSCDYCDHEYEHAICEDAFRDDGGARFYRTTNEPIVFPEITRPDGTVLTKRLELPARTREIHRHVCVHCLQGKNDDPEYEVRDWLDGWTCEDDRAIAHWTEVTDVTRKIRR